MTRATAAGQVAHTGGARSEDGRAAPGRENGREAPPRAAHEASGTGLAKSAKLAKPARMRAGLLRTSLRFLTWVCVGLLGLLSLLPGQDMVRTGFPGPLEHFAAYAGSGAIAMAGYGLNRGAVRVIGCLWVYAAILEYLQHFSPGRHPALEDFAASAFGALCGGVAVVLLWRWRSVSVGPRDGG
jgi:VanZ family protein